jgi:hypothetical protein
MRLRNHIAYRFLTDEKFIDEGMEEMHGKKWPEKPVEEIARVYDLLTFHTLKDPNKTYFVTDTVVDKLDMLHVKKTDDKYDWTVFSDVSDCKKTFIFNDNYLVRMIVYPDVIYFLHLSFTKEPTPTNKWWGQSYYVFFYVNRKTGEQCDHFKHPDVKKIETFIYKLLCFVFLSENTEEILKPGEKRGTQKSGKIINELNIPLTLITSKWKVTVIRTEGFAVGGHFRLQPYGPGLTKKRVIFIDPFEKHGYKRTYDEKQNN